MGITMGANAGEIVKKMEEQLRTDLLKRDGRLQEEKLWENTYIKRQIDKRREGKEFTIEDHIRAMVYAMLSAGASWDCRIAGEVDSETGRLVSVDQVFCGYDTEKLLKKTPEQIKDGLNNIGCAPRFLSQQMEALLSVNIPKLLAAEKEHGSIDAHYQTIIEAGGGLKGLVTALSDSESPDKMDGLGIPLACEYLRNIGHDIPKPDTHICRILGSGYLAFSDKPEAPQMEAFDIVVKLAEQAGKSPAETDYILWSYCADGYGEVCVKQKPKCEICAAKEICRRAFE